MSETAQQHDSGWHVVHNAAGTYSVWPAARPIPAGWQHVGTADTQDEALAAVAAAWVDVRSAAVGSSV